MPATKKNEFALFWVGGVDGIELFLGGGWWETRLGGTKGGVVNRPCLVDMIGTTAPVLLN